MITIPQTLAIVTVVAILTAVLITAPLVRAYRRKIKQLEASRARELGNILQQLHFINNQAAVVAEEADALDALTFDLRMVLESMMPVLLGHKELPGMYEDEHDYLMTMDERWREAVWRYENPASLGGEE